MKKASLFLKEILLKQLKGAMEVFSIGNVHVVAGSKVRGRIGAMLIVENAPLILEEDNEKSRSTGRYIVGPWHLRLA
jgi:hypothetical protein